MGWIFERAAGVAHCRTQNARLFPDEIFHAPKTAARQDRSFARRHKVTLVFLGCPSKSSFVLVLARKNQE
jgi:hypothetical protein